MKSWLALAARLATLAGVKAAQSPPATTWTLLSVPSPVFFSVTTIVTESPAWILVAETLFSVSAVEGLTTSTLPLWCSPVAGTAWPRASVPLPSAVQLKSLAGARKEHVKSTSSLWASEPLKAAPPTLVAEAVHNERQAPVPSTWTLVIVPSPVFFSRTTIDTESPAWTCAGALVWIVRVVAGMSTSYEPLTVSLASEAAPPSSSVPCPVADQLKSLPSAVNVQVKSTASPVDRLPVKEPPPTFVADAIQWPAVVPVVAHELVPVTLTLANVDSPVFVSRTTSVIDWLMSMKLPSVGFDDWRANVVVAVLRGSTKVTVASEKPPLIGTVLVWQGVAGSL